MSQAAIVELAGFAREHQAMVDKELTPEQKRLAANFTQALEEPKAPTPGQIAERCHVSEQAVSNWKRTGKIKLEHLLVVSEMTGWSVNRLVTGKEAAHSRPVDFNGRQVSDSDWDTLQDIAVLPHEEQRAERQRLFERAQVFRAYADEVIRKTRGQV